MSWLEEHITHVEEVVHIWLNGSDLGLEKAIQQTIDEGLFSKHDILFQLNVFRKNLQSGDIHNWSKKADLSSTNNGIGKKILCLHAGNLPLVGFQDALAVILSGADYYGKLSRKDPYLLSSFLRLVKEKELIKNGFWSTEIGDFENLEADKILFAGSDRSIEPVKKRIQEIRALKKVGEYVIRKAKFSIAYFDSKELEDIRNLVESILRYDGKGCRSVAMVVSPYSLQSVKDIIIGQMRLFWSENEIALGESGRLYYQQAYNDAIGVDQLYMGSVLIQHSEEFPELDGCIHWVEGSVDTVNEVKTKFGDMIQSVYSCTAREGFEEIGKAQRPSLYWEPDGIDVVSSIIK